MQPAPPGHAGRTSRPVRWRESTSSPPGTRGAPTSTTRRTGPRSRRWRPTSQSVGSAGVRRRAAARTMSPRGECGRHRIVQDRRRGTGPDLQAGRDLRVDQPRSVNGRMRYRVAAEHGMAVCSSPMTSRRSCPRPPARSSRYGHLEVADGRAPHRGGPRPPDIYRSGGVLSYQLHERRDPPMHGDPMSETTTSSVDLETRWAGATESSFLRKPAAPVLSHPRAPRGQVYSNRDPGRSGPAPPPATC
jgi:hypothetical protein